MAPAIPTHRPLLTATRLALLVAVAASASSVYLAVGRAQAAETAMMIPAGACPAAAAHASI